MNKTYLENLSDSISSCLDNFNGFDNDTIQTFILLDNVFPGFISKLALPSFEFLLYEVKNK